MIHVALGITLAAIYGILLLASHSELAGVIASFLLLTNTLVIAMYITMEY
jgi:hypothetical protein